MLNGSLYIALSSKTRAHLYNNAPPSHLCVFVHKVKRLSQLMPPKGVWPSGYNAQSVAALKSLFLDLVVMACVCVRWFASEGPV